MKLVIVLPKLSHIHLQANDCNDWQAYNSLSVDHCNMFKSCICQAFACKVAGIMSQVCFALHTLYGTLSVFYGEMVARFTSSLCLSHYFHEFHGGTRRDLLELKIYNE